MARARLSYEKRMGQRFTAPINTPNFQSMADRRTRVYRVAFSDPRSGKAGRGEVLALSGAHATAVYLRRLEQVVGPYEAADLMQDVTVQRLGTDIPWHVAEETPDEQTARVQEMARLMSGGAV